MDPIYLPGPGWCAPSTRSDSDDLAADAHRPGELIGIELAADDPQALGRRQAIGDRRRLLSRWSWAGLPPPKNSIPARRFIPGHSSKPASRHAGRQIAIPARVFVGCNHAAGIITGSVACAAPQGFVTPSQRQGDKSQDAETPTPTPPPDKTKSPARSPPASRPRSGRRNDTPPCR